MASPAPRACARASLATAPAAAAAAPTAAADASAAVAPVPSERAADEDDLSELAELALSDDLPCLPFELGNPAVELIEGRLFLSEPPPPPDDAGDEADEPSLDDDGLANGPAKPAPVNRHRTSLVCLLDIPAHLTLHELHSFLLESPCFDDLMHMQLCRLPARARRGDGGQHPPADPTYAALLHFRAHAAAQAFVRDFHGLAYNSLEPETCRPVFVMRVAFDDERYAFPTAAATHALTPVPTAAAASVAAAASSALAPNKQLQLRKQSRDSASSPALHGAAGPSAANSHLLPPGSTVLLPSLSAGPDASAALPSCPVCLEAIHPSSAACASSAAPSASLQSTPMLTLLCNHVFHLGCLASWIPSSSSSSCPVCRYMLQPDVHTSCATCGQTERLWMCILCGSVGCSRYAQGHAFEHYQATQHNYAIEVLTQRVWDYTADCYVHRLVRNKTDGKLVELSRGSLADEDVRSEHAPSAAGVASGKLASLHSQSLSSSAGAPLSSSSLRPLLSSPSPAPLVVHPSSSAYASVKLEEFLLVSAEWAARAPGQQQQPEYNHLLASQLDQQRRVFQQAIRQSEMGMQRRREERQREVDATVARRDELRVQLAAAAQARTDTEARLAQLTASYAAQQAQSAQLASLHTKLLSSHSSQRASLATSAKLYAKQQDALLAEQDACIAGLEEQVADLAFFLDTQKKINKMDARQPQRGLKAQLSSGQAQLHMVEVTPDEDDAKTRKGQRKKRG